jgi:asparagine synthase (glutamine-hydrolysing)
VGLIGLAGEWSAAAAESLLRKMGHALDPGDRVHGEFEAADGWGLGRVQSGPQQSVTQPVWDPDRQCALMLDGDILDYEADKRALVAKAGSPRIDSDAAFALAMYLQHGESFVERLNGAFAIAIWDARTRTLLLANDRWTLFPLYYTQTATGLLIGSGVRALLAEPRVSGEVEELSLGQMVSFDHLLGDATLLKAVKLLRSGHLLTYRAGTLRVRPYWQMRHPESYAIKREADWMDEFGHYWSQAVRRQDRGSSGAGVLLSGGLDSRLILGALGRIRGGDSLHAFTWGIPGCDDARFARQLSRKVGARFQFDELEPDWLRHKADEGVRLTDGMANLVNLHALANVEAQTRQVGAIYKGFMGDALLGFPLRYQHWASYSPDQTYAAHHQVHLDQGTKTFTPEDYERLFTPACLARMSVPPEDSYRAALEEYRPRLMAEQRVYYSLTHRTPRLALNGVLVVRSRAAVRLPFADNDLVDFSLSVPPGLLYQRRLVRQTFIRDFPELAKVPSTDTGLPMMDCFQDVWLRAENFARSQLHRRGLTSVRYPDRRKYQNYDLWFRTVLRDWTEGILLDKRTLERGYFEPGYIRNVVASHMTGAVNKAAQLGSLLSIELWHRQALDGRRGDS